MAAVGNDQNLAAASPTSSRRSPIRGAVSIYTLISVQTSAWRVYSPCSFVRFPGPVGVLDALCGTSVDCAGTRRWCHWFAPLRLLVARPFLLACRILSLASFLSFSPFFRFRFAFIRLSARSRHLRCPSPLRTTGLASSFKRAQSSLRDLRCLILGLASLGDFLLTRPTRIPVFSGFAVSSALDALSELRHTGETVKIGLTRPLPVRFVSCSFWNARVTCFCETRASPVFVFSFSPSLE